MYRFLRCAPSAVTSARVPPAAVYRPPAVCYARTANKQHQTMESGRGCRLAAPFSVLFNHFGFLGAGRKANICT